MNTLEHYIRVKKLNPTNVMNNLQDNGIISDECINPWDVFDSGKSVSWLEKMDVIKPSMLICEKKFDF